MGADYVVLGFLLLVVAILVVRKRDTIKGFLKGGRSGDKQQRK